VTPVAIPPLSSQYWDPLHTAAASLSSLAHCIVTSANAKSTDKQQTTNSFLHWNSFNRVTFTSSVHTRCHQPCLVPSLLPSPHWFPNSIVNYFVPPVTMPHIPLLVACVLDMNFNVSCPSRNVQAVHTRHGTPQQPTRNTTSPHRPHEPSVSILMNG